MTSTQAPEHTNTLVQQWRVQILNNLSSALVVLGGIALIIGSWADYSAAGERALPYIGVYFLAYLF